MSYLLSGRFNDYILLKHNLVKCDFLKLTVGGW